MVTKQSCAKRGILHEDDWTCTASRDKSCPLPERRTCRAEKGFQGRVEQQQVAAPRVAAGAVGQVALDGQARVADLGQRPPLAPPAQNLAGKEDAVRVTASFTWRRMEGGG